MSAQELITEHLDLWTSATTHAANSRGKNGKVELIGIQKLRELIRELAVRGELGTQDELDESAANLLDRMEEEKRELFREGKIKKPKESPEIQANETPYNIPDNWVWCRLGQTFNAIISGGTPNKKQPKFWNGEIPWASVKDLGKATFIDDTQDHITESGLQAGSKLADAGDILICTRMGLGKTAICERPIAINQDLKAVKLSSQVTPKFFLLAYSTLDISGTGTTVSGITQDKLQNYLLALPPIEEQDRIVQKVDELMALCDRLEQQTSDQLEAHETLVDTLLNTLTQSENATELADNWARLAAHFDTLFTTEQSIDKLKQVVLELAFMGKLVEQSARDKPASVLLAKAAEEKLRLVRKGRSKKLRPQPSVEDIPYNVPKGWQWERIGNFALVGTGATPTRDRADYYFPPEHPWVTSGETGQDYIFDTKEKVSSLAVNETNITIYPEGTLIVAMYGQGKTRGQVSELRVAAGTNQACAAIRPIINDANHRRYIKLCFMKVYDEIREGAAGGAQPNLNMGKIANTLIPVPPLAEQTRIVQKVDELLALCVHLKERLNEANEIRCQLAETVAEQAIS